MIYKESEQVELKSSFSEWKEIIISLAAFANKKGGTVVVGLDDKGQPLHMKLGKNTIEDSVNKVKNHTDPGPIAQGIGYSKFDRKQSFNSKKYKNPQFISFIGGS